MKQKIIFTASHRGHFSSTNIYKAMVAAPRFCIHPFFFFSHSATMRNFEQASQEIPWIRQFLGDFASITCRNNPYTKRQVHQIRCRYCDISLTNRGMRVFKYAVDMARAKESSQRHFISCNSLPARMTNPFRCLPLTWSQTRM